MILDADTKAAINVLKNATTETNLALEMGRFGFKMPKHDGYSSVGLVWVGKNFVVKNAYFFNKQEIPKRAVPQKKLGTICNLRGWIAQAKCEPISKAEYKKVMAGRFFTKREKEVFDLNECNVGKYNGKIVAFDW